VLIACRDPSVIARDSTRFDENSDRLRRVKFRRVSVSSILCLSYTCVVDDNELDSDESDSFDYKMKSIYT